MLLDMKNHRRLFSTTYQIQVRPVKAVSANAVTLDKHQRLIVDGKPFMPIGIYAAWQGSVKDKDLKRIADAGFNTVHLYGLAWHRGPGKHASDMAGIRAGVDQVHKYGLKLVASVKEQLHGWNHKVDNVSGNIPVVKKLVSELKNHPAILVWYVSDEEARSRVPDIIKLREAVSAIDPDHPTWTLTCFYDDLAYYATSGDILGIDPYPIKATHGPQSLRELQEALEAGAETGAPIWHVPQAFNWAIVDKTMNDETFRKTRFLTREEVRTAPLLGAIYGAKGFVFYAYYDIAEMERRAPDAANATGTISRRPFSFARSGTVYHEHGKGAGGQSGKLPSQGGLCPCVCERRESPRDGSFSRQTLQSGSYDSRTAESEIPLRKDPESRRRPL